MPSQPTQVDPKPPVPVFKRQVDLRADRRVGLTFEADTGGEDLYLRVASVEPDGQVAMVISAPPFATPVAISAPASALAGNSTIPQDDSLVFVRQSVKRQSAERARIVSRLRFVFFSCLGVCQGRQK